MASTDLSGSLLSYIQSAQIPSDHLLQSDLEPTSLPNIISTLEKARSSLIQEIQSSSAHLALDVTTWISQARQLQTDVQHTKQSAQDLVSLNAEAQKAKEAVRDKEAAIALLKREARFAEALEGQLEALAVAVGLVDSARDALAENNVKEALDKLGQAEKVRQGLEREGRGARVLDVLRRRGEGVRAELGDVVRGRWTKLVKVDTREKSVEVQAEDDGEGLEEVVNVLDQLSGLDGVLARFHRDFDTIVIAPRIIPKTDGSVAKLELATSSIKVVGRQSEATTVETIQDVFGIIKFLHSVFPKQVSTNLLTQILPTLVLQLISTWLDPSMPVELDNLDLFKQIIVEVQKLAGFITTLHIDLPSEANLESWLKRIPPNWVARRKEKALLDIRTRSYDAVKRKLKAEIVETQIVDSDDAMFGGRQNDISEKNGDEEEWGEDWGENEDEDQHTNGKVDIEPAENADEDDWGQEWGDEDDEPSSPVKSSKPAKTKPSKTKSTSVAKSKVLSQKEITLRETYTTTAIPTIIIQLLTTLLNDASTLKAPDFSFPTLVPATNALATIPTLILAFYRATAHSYYANDPAGNMLVYNDTQNLITLLKDEFLPNIPSTHPLASRIKLDPDLESLSTFSRRAYAREMDSQRTILRDILSSASGFVNVTAPLNRKQYSETIDDAVRRVQDMDRAWRGVLSDSARLQSLGSLLSVLAGQIVSDILERADDIGGISEEASKLLKIFIDKIAELQELFRDGEKDNVYIYVPGWFRFMYLGQILEASLADIKYLWTDGELSLEFESAEVIDLIMALFTESHYRKEAIRVIRSGGRA